jgi:hypothetical protein
VSRFHEPGQIANYRMSSNRRKRGLLVGTKAPSTMAFGSSNTIAICACFPLTHRFSAPPSTEAKKIRIAFVFYTEPAKRVTANSTVRSTMKTRSDVMSLGFSSVTKWSQKKIKQSPEGHRGVRLFPSRQRGNGSLCRPDRREGDPKDKESAFMHRHERGRIHS